MSKYLLIKALKCRGQDKDQFGETTIVEVRKTSQKYGVFCYPIGILSESAKGWKKELNMISWNGAAEKYDIRDWAPEHEKMGKGITLSQEEAEALYELLGKTLKKQL